MALIKMNGVNYWGSSYGQGIIAPMIYSEEEIEVGVWTDGKPLYQKTVTIPISSQAGDITYSFETGINIHNAFGIIKTQGGFEMSLPASYSNIFYCGLQYDSSEYIRLSISSTSAWQNYNTLTEADVTIQYTKTTDTAGSGSWTPSGANAVHYSFTEHIAGTWFGETLWEKTIAYVSSAGQADTDKVIDTSIRHGTNCYVVDLQGIQTYGYLRNNSTSPTPNATSDPEPLSQGTLYLPFYGGSSMNSAHIYLYSDGIHFKKRGGSANANSIILTVRYVKI